MSDSWRRIAARKQDEQRARLPPQWLLPHAVDAAAHRDVTDIARRCGVLTKRELEITGEYDATSLLAQLASGRVKSEDVVRAFCKRAAVAHQLTNCLTEILFDDGLARARQLDDHLARTGQPVGPLHGLPVSLKDTFKIRGYDASLGIASLCFRPAASNSALVDVLLALGAVLYCKTNVPQTLAALDSHNNVFGRTLNPHNRNLTAGGSSGGEGALLALRGSVLGVGTDVGGSIRIPAACNGVYGVKPSHGRVPFAGQELGGKPGGSKLAIEPTAGPLATSLRDCAMFLRVVADARPSALDPDVIAQTWEQQDPLPLLPPSLPVAGGGLSEQQQLLLQQQQQQRQRPLRVGVLRTDGHVQPLPPVDRFLSEVVHALRSSSAAGNEAQPRIELIEIDATPVLSRVIRTFNGMMSVDGANSWFDLLQETGEPLSPWLQSRLRRRPGKTTPEVRDLQAQKLALQTQFLSVWHEAGGCWPGSAGAGDSRQLDVLICPVAPHPTPPIDRWNSVNYTGAFNLLDLPAGILPVRSFAESDLRAGQVPSTEPLNGWDKVNRELWDSVDRNVYVGGPWSLQVVSPRLTERRLVEAMAVIDSALAPLRESSRQSDVARPVNSRL